MALAVDFAHAVAPRLSDLCASKFPLRCRRVTHVVAGCGGASPPHRPMRPISRGAPARCPPAPPVVPRDVRRRREQHQPPLHARSLLPLPVAPLPARSPLPLPLPLPVRVLPARAVLDLDVRVHPHGAVRQRQRQPISLLPQCLLRLLLFH